MQRPTLHPRVAMLPGHQESLEDRVDAAGIRQRENPTEARRLRDQSREAAEDAPGWYHYHGGQWVYHGNGPRPSRGPVQ